MFNIPKFHELEIKVVHINLIVAQSPEMSICINGFFIVYYVFYDITSYSHIPYKNKE